ncbi:hypothetical protein HPB47_013173 [Ixodes persulcatus]|uniref:Uncharacterized protein n=1 Tax=Ixodes persulcatus TaxID=34615 RepID=A0AC60NRI8_IXOPE|nr:hypothetical protein HPB47_013173 [Ixodes persulcatus]
MSRLRKLPCLFRQLRSPRPRLRHPHGSVAFPTIRLLPLRPEEVEPGESSKGRRIDKRKMDKLRAKNPARRPPSLVAVGRAVGRASDFPFEHRSPDVKEDARAPLFPAIPLYVRPRHPDPSATAGDTPSGWAGPAGCASSLTLPGVCAPDGGQEQQMGGADFRPIQDGRCRSSVVIPRRGAQLSPAS